METKHAGIVTAVLVQILLTSPSTATKTETLVDSELSTEELKKYSPHLPSRYSSHSQVSPGYSKESPKQEPRLLTLHSKKCSFADFEKRRSTDQFLDPLEYHSIKKLEFKELSYNRDQTEYWQFFSHAIGELELKLKRLSLPLLQTNIETLQNTLQQHAKLIKERLKHERFTEISFTTRLLEFPHIKSIVFNDIENFLKKSDIHLNSQENSARVESPIEQLTKWIKNQEENLKNSHPEVPR